MLRVSPEPLMTPEEVAGLLRVPKQTIYTWRYHAKGPRAIVVGRHLRFRRSDVEAWMDEQTR